jgi:hypothetical protein
MIGHQTVTMADPTVARDHLGERVEKQLSVSVIEKDLLAGIAAAGQAVDCSGEFHP